VRLRKCSGNIAATLWTLIATVRPLFKVTLVIFLPPLFSHFTLPLILWVYYSNCMIGWRRHNQLFLLPRFLPSNPGQGQSKQRRQRILTFPQCKINSKFQRHFSSNNVAKATAVKRYKLLQYVLCRLTKTCCTVEPGTVLWQWPRGKNAPFAGYFIFLVIKTSINLYQVENILIILPFWQYLLNCSLAFRTKTTFII
jgi:hypothetical protein